MITRFQIEDLVAQDGSGVVFRALDKETGLRVAVRRFFPFGVEGGGLLADEQAAYHRALGRLTGLRHPAMRAVIGGGCDPVDGMPYIVTEWIDGVPLQECLARSPLSGSAAIGLLGQVVDVCGRLSQLLGEEAVWVDTGMQSLIVGTADSGRGITCWIAPLRWLGEEAQSSRLQPLIDLTEKLMRRAGGQAASGLGGWLNWLRQEAGTATLSEARARLEAVAGEEVLSPRKRVVIPAVRRSPLLLVAANGWWIVNLGLTCVAIVLGAWLSILVRLHDGGSSASAAESHKPAVTGRPAEAAAVVDLPVMAQPAELPQPAAVGALAPVARRNDGVIHWSHRELLAHIDDQAVVVEGVLAKIDFSGRKKTMYLLFSKEPEKNDPRGAVMRKSAGVELSESALAPLIGKKVRLHGTVKVQKGFGLERPDIFLKDRGAIEIVE